MRNPYVQPIYTITNWVMINYLFGNAAPKSDRLPVFLNVGSEAYRAKLAALKRHSPYLAAIVGQHVATNGVIFTRHFEWPKASLPKKLPSPNTKSYGKVYIKCV